MSSGNTNRANLPAAILVFAFLMIWQMAALGMDAAYILPSPIQVVQKLWDLRGPLFTAHLPATMQVVAIGLIISIVLGMALAILMDASPVAEKGLSTIKQKNSLPWPQWKSLELPILQKNVTASFPVASASVSPLRVRLRASRRC